MRLVSVIGQMASLDKVVYACGKSGVFQPDDAMTFFSDTSDFMTIKEENPYSVPLSTLESAIARVQGDLSGRVAPSTMEMDDMAAYVEEFTAKAAEMSKRRSELTTKAEAQNRDIEQFEHFRGLNIDLDSIIHCETIKVRFNWNACCTPKKCREYFRRVVTDGPISRISFSTIERRPCGSELPVYGTYDAAFDEQLKPYIDNLVKARGLVDCPGARKLAQTLLDENAQFARLSQDVVFENLSFRANVIAYLKACVLYVANGMKWEKSIADFVRWSARYDLYCKLKLFGQMIYDADREQDSVPKTAPRGPKNMLEMLPEQFSLKDYANLRREQGFDDNRKRTMDAVYQWVSRGYVVKLLKDETADTDTDSLIFRKVHYNRSYLLNKE